MIYKISLIRAVFGKNRKWTKQSYQMSKFKTKQNWNVKMVRTYLYSWHRDVMPGLGLSVQGSSGSDHAILWVDAEELFYISVSWDHVSEEQTFTVRDWSWWSLCDPIKQSVMSESQCGLVLPDKVMGHICVLGMDTSHHSALRSILLHLESVTGRNKHWGLVCILHWDLSKTHMAFQHGTLSFNSKYFCQ